jgi:hypothetical protein
MNTNDQRESLEELKSLAPSQLFAGSHVRVVDEFWQVLLEPTVREAT